MLLLKLVMHLYSKGSLPLLLKRLLKIAILIKDCHLTKCIITIYGEIEINEIYVIVAGAFGIASIMTNNLCSFAF